MDSNLRSSLDSDSTFCSEIELTEPSRNKQLSSSRTHPSKGSQRRCYEPKKYFRNDFLSQKISSSPLLPSYTENDDFLPLSQVLFKNMPTGIISTQSRSNSQQESSKRRQKTYATQYKFKNYVNVNGLNKLEGWKPQNKIFKSQDLPSWHSTYKDINRIDNFDTASITSENVSKIVDREIAMHRKKRQQKCYIPAPCPCLSQIRKLNNIKIGNHKHTVSSVTENKKKQYKLTEDHIEKVAGYLKIDSTDLSVAIEKVLQGQDLEQHDYDDCDEIACSQSPIKRRYSSSS